MVTHTLYSNLFTFVMQVHLNHLCIAVLYVQIGKEAAPVTKTRHCWHLHLSAHPGKVKYLFFRCRTLWYVPVSCLFRRYLIITSNKFQT